jgi:hypothetical protein
MSKTSKKEKFLSKEDMLLLIEETEMMYDIRNRIYEKFGIDLLDSGDALSNLAVYNIVSQYDSSFLPNFHRNGVDGVSDNGDCELKTTRVDVKLLTPTGKKSRKNPLNGAWTLHAVSEYAQRYIFVALDKDTRKPVRIYDISEASNVQTVINHLEDQRQKFIIKTKGDPSKLKNDRIGINEKFIVENLTGRIDIVIDSCAVSRG